MPHDTSRERARGGTEPGTRLVVASGRVPAHDLLRTEAARFHAVPTAQIVLGHACPRCGSEEHGRPLLRPTAAVRDPAHVSLSRSGSLSMVAITDAGPVGIDVEAAGAAGFSGFADVGLHPSERAARRIDATLVWVRKESLLKAYGVGLAISPSEIAVGADGITAWDSDLAPPGRIWLRELDVPGHICAVTVLPRPDADAERLTVVLAPVTP